MPDHSLLSGIVFLDKPLGWTSRQAVNELVRLFTPEGCKRIKAGHAGTLDPLASGMLPILLGEATRFADYGLQAEKCYRFEMDLSLQTDTLDREGDVVSEFDVPELSRDTIDSVVQSFVGSQQQIPPSFSAIRINGQRLHTLARAGVSVDIPARVIQIYDVVLEEVSLPKLTLRVRCSKGTYIRSLARDMGQALELGGCVTALRRLSTGGWPEVMMVPITSLQRNPERYVVPLAQWLRELSSCNINDDLGQRFVQGQRLQLTDGFTDAVGEVAVFCDDTLLGTGEVRAGQFCQVLHPKKVLPSAREKWL